MDRQREGNDVQVSWAFLLTSCMLGKIFSRRHLKYFPYVFQKIRLDISCKLSHMENLQQISNLIFLENITKTKYMKHKTIFSEKKKMEKKHQFVVYWISLKRGKSYYFRFTHRELYRFSIRYCQTCNITSMSFHKKLGLRLAHDVC